MSAFSIRLARLHDADALPGIERAASAVFADDPDLGEVDMADGWTAEEHRSLIRRGHCLVAEIDGSLVGFIATEPFARELHIREMDVLPAHQRHGIGSVLLRGCMVDDHNSGFAALTLTTFRDLPWNAPFYSRLGFAEIDDLAPHPRLAAELASEVEAGLPGDRRVAMIRFLNER